MNGRRNVTRDIWRAVVVAGAMLAPACSSNPKPAAPAAAEPVPTEAAGEPGTEGDMGQNMPPMGTTGGQTGDEPPPAAAAAPAPPPPPDAGVPDAAPRPRKGSDRPRGRGFVLA